MTKLENDNIRYWVEDGILHNELKKPVIMTLETVKEFIALRHEISENKKQYWCSDVTRIKSFTKEGRDYADIHGQDFLHACAGIVNSHVTMYLFNIFVKIKTIKIPFRAFTSREKAVLWLNQLKKEENNG